MMITTTTITSAITWSNFCSVILVNQLWFWTDARGVSWSRYTRILERNHSDAYHGQWPCLICIEFGFSFHWSYYKAADLLKYVSMAGMQSFNPIYDLWNIIEASTSQAYCKQAWGKACYCFGGTTSFIY